MIPEKIEKLLNSDNADDNKIGWELVEAEKISFTDIQKYIEESKVPTGWRVRYTWNPEQNKFVKNSGIPKNSSITFGQWRALRQKKEKEC